MVEQTPGYYGKMPAYGDFVTRRLARSFVEPWDVWLQACISTSRDQLGDSWLQSYLVSPIWRFVLSEGICGNNAWFGLIMPSVDRVGRHFPLTLAMSVEANHSVICVANNEEQWFANAEEVALSALDKNIDLATFNEKINALGVPLSLDDESPCAQSVYANKEQVVGSSWRFRTSPTATLGTALPLVTEQFLVAHFSAFSLWWTSGSEHVEPSLLACPELPAANCFSSLLNGNWMERGWDTRLTMGPSETV